MPIKKAAEKALRQSKKKALANARSIKQIKSLSKETKRAITTKATDQVSAKLKLAVKAIDKAVQNGKLKKNAGARKKSRLVTQANKIK